ncbi:MAG: hypothetical protein ABIR56_07985 [Polaromonas sp.]
MIRKGMRQKSSFVLHRDYKSGSFVKEKQRQQRQTSFFLDFKNRITPIENAKKPPQVFPERL